MDFLQYIFVLLEGALVSFSSVILTYGADLSISLLWVGISVATFTYFFYNLKATPLSGFVIYRLKKGKYLNQGALGGVLHKWHKMKMIVQLGQLLVEIEDNNQDISSINVAEAKRRWKRAVLENIYGFKFNWEYVHDTLHSDPRKARQARRAFVGEENWHQFKSIPSANYRKEFFRLAKKLAPLA